MSKVCSRPGCKRGTRTNDLCLYHRPRTPIKARVRYIKSESNKARIARIQVRDEWFKQHPPNMYGLWECYLRGLSPTCWLGLNKSEIIRYGLEHKVPKVKSRSLKFEVSNLAAACPPCNKLKGSRTLEQLSDIYLDWHGPLE